MKIVKPNLFVAGAAKSGTSSLHDYLQQHPEVFMSDIKEPHFFSHEEKYNSESKHYYKLFEQGRHHIYRGESSTGYMVFPNVVERIKKDIHNPKFIFVLRNPIDRIYSHYNWIKSLGGEEKTFFEAIYHDMNNEPKTSIRYALGYRNYFQYGLYGKWLKNYYQNYDSDDILVILNEQLRDNPIDTMNKCFSFLGLENVDTLERKITNMTEHFKKPQLYRKILALFNQRAVFDFLQKKSPVFLFKLFVKARHNTFIFFRNIFITKRPINLTETERNKLKKMYFDDVKWLKTNLNLEFDLWKDFVKD